jgi:dolichyl-phosphate-mannose-protein mannosyltransferase
LLHHTAENMSTPNSSIRHRGPQKDKVKANGKAADQDSNFLDDIVQTGKEAVSTQWEYKLALGIITVLSFITRFWGISHPNEVVFDEVHFGKVHRTPLLIFGRC